jgi:hypothetical protein
MAGPRNPAAAWPNAKILLTGHGAHRRLLSSHATTDSFFELRSVMGVPGLGS